MIQNRFLRNVSVNTLQLIVNQVFGLAIFYALSKGLDKNIFGQINWALAVLLTLFSVLTFGIDQVIVNKIAAGYNRESLFSTYLFHVLISGFACYGLLLLVYFLFPGMMTQQVFLLFIGFGKLAIFLSTPFKQLATALEKFNGLFFMSIVSNIIRGSLLLLFFLLHNMSVRNVLIAFIAGDLTELAICMIIAKPFLRKSFKIRWNKRRQVLLLRESLPQTGVVIFTAVMARFDWILVGLLISSSKLAEYSFAYKIFEVSTLPLLILAPIMIPLFTRLNKTPGNLNNLFFFLEWQIIIASFIAMMLNVCWIPVIDFISDGSYGRVNSGTVFLLSLSMPLLYFTNYLWTVNFARANLKLVFFIMAVAFAVNIVSCSILIPLYKNEGAALAYFITVSVQLILYLRKKTLPIPGNRGIFLLLWPVTALITGWMTSRYMSPGAGIISAVAVYIMALFISGKIRWNDWKILQSMYQ
jgi:O-antigen/teichoic acid export membrane protein